MNIVEPYARLMSPENGNRSAQAAQLRRANRIMPRLEHKRIDDPLLREQMLSRKKWLDDMHREINNLEKK